MQKVATKIIAWIIVATLIMSLVLSAIPITGAYADVNNSVARTVWFPLSRNMEAAEEPRVYQTLHDIESYIARKVLCGKEAKDNILVYYDQRSQPVANYMDSVVYEPDVTTSKVKDFTTIKTVDSLPGGFHIDVPAGSRVIVYPENGQSAECFYAANHDETYVLNNLIPYTEYRIVTIHGLRVANRQRVMPVGATRFIRTEVLENVRDLGGWKTANGYVQYGKLFRGAAIPTAPSNELAKDLQTLKELGVTVELDLRFLSEINETLLAQENAYGKNKSQIEGAVYCNLPTFAYRDGVVQVNKKSESLITALRFVIESINEDQIIYFHCHLGADRAGTLAFMLEGLLGVSESDLDKDYELTSFAYAGGYRQRASSEYIAIKQYINELEGDSLQEKFRRWFLQAGFTDEELDMFIDKMTDTKMTIPDIPENEIILVGQDDVPVISEDPQDINLFIANNQIGDACYTPMEFNPLASQNYANIISNGATLLAEKGIRLFSMPGPTSVGLLNDHYRKIMRSAEPSENLEYIESLTNDLVYNVNVYPILREHDDEYLYFRTDHHWTALAAYYSYVAFCEKAGLTAAPLDSFEEFSEGEFRGTYYPTAADPQRLTPDELIAYRPYGNYTMEVKTHDGPKSLFFDNPIVDYSDKYVYDKYNSFILGDNYFVHITNEDLPDTAPSCAVIKDSFGDPFAVYLTQNYKHVYVLDYRHFKTPVYRFADEVHIDDVIIAQSMGVSQTFLPSAALAERLGEGN